MAEGNSIYKTIDQIKTECEQIKNETTAKANSATRVGGAMLDIINHVEQQVDGKIDDKLDEFEETFETNEAARDAKVDAKVVAITDLQDDVSELKDIVNGEPLTKYDGAINSSGNWTNPSSTNDFYVVEATENDIINVTPNGVSKSNLYFLSQFDGVVYGQSANVISSKKTSSVSTEETITIPSGTSYLMVVNTSSNVNICPTSVLKNGEDIFDVKGLADDIDALKSNVSILDETVSEQEDNINTLTNNNQEFNEKIGEVIEYYAKVTLPSYSNGGLGSQSIGSSINITTSTAYHNVSVNCNSGDNFKIDTVVNVTATAYPKYIVITDTNNIVVAVYGSNDGSDADKIEVINTTQSRCYYSIVVPNGGKKVYVGINGSQNINVYKKSYKSLQSQIDEIKEDIGGGEIVGLDILDEKRGVILEHNKNKKFLNFQMITDTHLRFDDDYDRNPIANIKLFAEFGKEKIADFAIHGGDVITSYDLTVNDAAKWFDNSTQILGNIPIPLYIAKGNHDVVGRNSGDVYMTEPQYHIVAQNHLHDVHVNSNEPYNNYFYIDFNSEKIRVIVLNLYVVDNNNISVANKADEAKWLATEALDLPEGFDAVVVGHSSVTGVAPWSNILSAFNNGENLTYTYYGKVCDKDYSVIGRGHLVAYIHGHEHNDGYKNTDGYNDIGMICGFDESTTKDDNYIAFSVFSVDTETNVLYETRFGKWKNSDGTSRTTDRSWSYGTSSQQLT